MRALTSHLFHSFQQVFHQDGGKRSRRGQVSKEGICYQLQSVVLVDTFHHVLYGGLEDLSECQWMHHVELEEGQ